MKNNKKMGITLRQIIYVALFIFILGTILSIKQTENITETVTIAEVIEEKNIIAEESEDKENIINEEIIADNGVETERQTNSEVMSRSSISRTSRQQEIEETIQYKSLEEITISKNMDLTVRTGISKEDFKTLISKVKQDSSKFFYENSDLIYDLCEEYEINEIFFCGLISAESGWNIASNHRKTYNYISLMYNGKLIQYSSVEEGLTVAAQKLHNNYLTPGGSFYYGKTLSAVKTKFCPASNTWVNLVYGRMQQIVNNI